MEYAIVGYDRTIQRIVKVIKETSLSLYFEGIYDESYYSYRKHEYTKLLRWDKKTMKPAKVKQGAKRNNHNFLFSSSTARIATEADKKAVEDRNNREKHINKLIREQDGESIKDLYRKIDGSSPDFD